MKVSVWDTYVQREDGQIMHFDILAPKEITDEQTIFQYGMNYLRSKPFQTNQLSAKECRLCHIEQASDEVIASIASKGYFIIEMENCSSFN